MFESRWPAVAYCYLGWGYALNRAREYAAQRKLKTYVYKSTLEGSPVWVVSWDPKDVTT